MQYAKPEKPRAGQERKSPAPRPKKGDSLESTTLSAQGIMELQRLAGNASVTRMIQSAQHSHRPGSSGSGGGGGGEQTVQRSRIDDVLRTPGRPLHESLRVEMESRMGTDFSDVRLHTGTAAEHSAAEIGASAYTSGNHVVIGQAGTDRHTLAHELTHVIQQRRGPVAGTDHGNGLKISDPSDRFEQEAETNATRVMRSSSRPAVETPAGSAADIARKPATQPASVQRYHVVEPNSGGYPAKRQKQLVGPSKDLSEDDQFFVRQGMNDLDSFYDSKEPPEPHLIYEGAVSLAISDNFDLAVHNPVDGAEPKHFFALEQKLKESNDLLKGKVLLKKTGKYLKIEGDGRKVRLFEVIPEVRLPGSGVKAKGLDARTPQRCNAMAQFVTASHDIATGTSRYYRILGDLVDRLAPGNDFRQNIEQAMATGNEAAFNQISFAMSRAFQDLMLANHDQVEATLRDLGFNEFAPAPKPGSAMSIIGYGDTGQEAERRAERERGESAGFEYHYGGVVAKSGTDFITMENYARSEGVDTLDSGDPLWYFRMYGAAKPEQSWHKGWSASGAFRGAVLTIVIE